jgi:hypothetical protein
MDAIDGTADVERRLLAGLTRESEESCWEWQNSTDRYGYGWISVDGRNRRTHVVAHMLWVGPVAPGDHVLHGPCDNPPCCNPAHLRIGDAADNAADRSVRLRSGRARLSADDVRAIRADPRSSAEVASDYGVSPGYVRRVRTGDRQRHIA